jgi:hypothetical protein
LTLGDALAQFERQGFRSQFFAREGGELECSNCHTRLAAEEVAVQSMRRVEGASDPADMSVVAAITCPQCGARGTGTFGYGPTSPREDSEVLRRLDQSDRERQRLIEAVPSDRSLVKDSGWLPGPPEG